MDSVFIMIPREKSHPTPGDALLIIDPQNDFFPGGALPVSEGFAILEPLQSWIDVFDQMGLSIFMTRDCHPEDHCSFVAQGGIWPPHCVKGTVGFELTAALRFPATAFISDKPYFRDLETYDGFSGTDLEAMIRERGVSRLWIGGLATDYCVLHTALEALRLGFEVFLMVEAVRAVNLDPGDGDRALKVMQDHGAVIFGGP